MTDNTPTQFWSPTQESIDRSQLARFTRFLNDSYGAAINLGDYQALHTWSVEHSDRFWSAVWEYFDVRGQRSDTPVTQTVSDTETTWFSGSQINYAENILRWTHERPDSPALIGLHETAQREEISWKELAGQVGALAQHFRSRGVRPGDVVCAVLPNIPQTVVALLATASVGAIWTVVNTDFGTHGVKERFEQLQPKVLLTTDSVHFGGKVVDKTAQLPELLEALPTVKHHVLVDTDVDSDETLPAASARLSDILASPQEPDFTRVEFNSPLWVLYSSGTTGKPKGIVHSHGGVVLESLKANALQYDVRPGDRTHFAASTTWVIWNMMIATLFVGATVVTYDGSPAHPDTLQHLKIVSEEQVAFFGTGAAVLTMGEKSGLSHANNWDFSHLRFVLSSGSALPPTTWKWLREQIGTDFHLGSDSGGTDIATGIIGSNPWDVQNIGELQGPYLGVDARSVGPDQETVTDEVGELIIANRIPSMPIYLWGDTDRSRYTETYFSTYKGIWRQGDWVTNTSAGGWIVHGRSDSTINRGGVRMGSADICRVVDEVDGVTSSMVIGAELKNGGYYMPLFVVTTRDEAEHDALEKEIVAAIRQKVSPRYVPDAVIFAPDVPLTRTGKLMEVPVKRLFQGASPDSLNRTASQNPEVLNWYSEQATKFAQWED
ncbi:acetoacetate--CoA ligase [Brevibacterium sp. UMB1308A]|uniref:acetoacetate--CoA ligase n=1 Tax=Brevibacterium sp. UMB1308A TaxID=3050608 RepID=UPI0025510034|nr:acetoacetate--CoA ligase [Brevibacterium sp. UMB1308A]MDK8347089.1 acetoacetate--CoA ligase [Brevibacterium sp. UMB1308B]MDK8712757.1 acetoacetate--CoA ligase [Brevibacterium sp. UMB1308A]